MTRTKKMVLLIAILMLCLLLLGAAGNGWQKQSGGQWKYIKNGTVQTGWLNESGTWYYLRPKTGLMQTGWLQWRGQWYYLTGSGAMVTSWLRIKGTWYYLSESGAMQTGWLRDNSMWYYLTKSGAMTTGWYNVKGKWYYAASSGAMLANQLINGYWLGEDGAWQPEHDQNPTDDGKDDETDNHLPLAGVVIGLDPGHQNKQNKELEPVAPGSGERKKKVSSGTQGRFTRVAEHEVNLKVGLKLRDLLKEQGATVYMTRVTGDVNVSNSERAVMMNDYGCDLVIRLHCDGNDDPARHGVSLLVPVGKYTAAIEEPSREAGEYVLAAFVKQTGAKNNGIKGRADQTGFNWSTVPIINVEMGYMTNKNEDNLLVTGAYQDKCAKGICNGVIDYFS